MFVHNKQIAVQTMGIRYIQKLDQTTFQSNRQFGLRIKYKAAELVEYFKLESARDDFYDEIIKNLK